MARSTDNKCHTDKSAIEKEVYYVTQTIYKNRSITGLAMGVVTEIYINYVRWHIV